MNGSCNAGTTTSNTKGKYGKCEFWINENEIANLLSVPMLESMGYTVATHTYRDWVGITPNGKTIVFKRDTGMCKGMSYIELRTNKLGVALIETVRKNVGVFTKKETEKAKLSRVV